MTEQDEKLLSVVCKALPWYPEGPTVDDSVNAIAIAVLAWSRMSDEAKQAAPDPCIDAKRIVVTAVTSAIGT